MIEVDQQQNQEQIHEIAAIVNGIITQDLVLLYLTKLQPPSPSGTVLHTRTPIIQELLRESGLPDDQFIIRFLGTRSPAVVITPPHRDRFWVSAHSDQPTYIPPATDEYSFDIKPICAHRPKKTSSPFPQFPAAVLRYSSLHGKYEIVSEGVIGTQENMKPFYTATTKPKGGFKPGDDRIVYAPQLAYNPDAGLVSGNIDNAAGIAASIAAIQALLLIAQNEQIPPEEFNVKFIFPDEEEGLPDDPAYFAREARRIIHRTPEAKQPEYIVNIDGHDTVDGNEPQPVAVYGSMVSGGKGPIVPPDVYALFDNFLRGLEQYGVRSQPTDSVPASLSRSDDAGYMEKHGQVIPIGYLVRDPHHNQGLATANLEGLVNTAKAITWIAAACKK